MQTAPQKHPWVRLGIRGRFAIMLSTLIIPMIALFAYTLNRENVEEIDRELEANREVAEAIGLAFESYLNHLWQKEAALGATITSLQISPDEIKPLLQAQVQESRSTRWMSWLDPNGVILASTAPNARGISLADRDHIQHIIQGASTTVSDLMTSRITNQLCLAVARGIRQDGQLLGIVVTCLPPDALENALPMQRQRSGTIYGVVDRQGYTIHTDRAQTLTYEQRKITPGTPAYQALQGRTAIQREYRDTHNGPTWMGAAIPIPSLGFAVFASTDVRTLSVSFRQNLARSAAVAAVMLSLSLAGLLPFADRIIRRIQALGAAAEALAAGDYGATLTVQGNDEIALTAQAFNLMAERVSITEQELRRQVRQQEALVQLSNMALAKQNLDQVLQTALTTISKVLEADYYLIRGVFPEEGTYLIMASSSRVESPLGGPGTTGPIDGHLTYLLQAKGPVIVEDFDTEKRFEAKGLLLNLGLVSGVGVAIPQFGEPAGAMGAYSASRQRFTRQDAQFLESVAFVVSTALERSRIEERKTVEQVIIGALASCASTKQAMDQVLQALGEGFKWAHASFWQLCSDSVGPLMTHRWNAPSSPLGHLDLEWLISRKLLVMDPVLARRQPLLIPDCRTWADSSSAIPDQVRGLMAVPVLTGDRVRGVIVLIDHRIRQPDAVQVETVTGTAVLLAQHMAREEASAALFVSNEKLRRLIHACPVPILFIDRQRQVEACNPALLELTGLTEDQLIGRPVPPQFGASPDEVERLSRLIEEDGSITGYSVRRHRPDGTPFDVNLSIAPTWNETGQVTGHVVVIVDITERARFLQIAAHELRNPMAGVKGLLSLMQRRYEAGRPVGDIARIVGVIEREVDRLSLLLDQILESFQVQEGRLELTSKMVDVNQVVETATAPWKEQEFVPLRVDLSPQRAWVMGDPLRLDEVFRNLTSNAVKYSEPGRPVEVSVMVDAQSVHIAVRDSGIGIPADNLDRIFEAFYRCKSQTGPDPGGIGLGLFISRDLVERHGGRIWAESRPGEGSTFHVTLPRLKGGCDHSGTDSRD